MQVRKGICRFRKVALQVNKCVLCVSAGNAGGGRQRAEGARREEGCSETDGGTCKFESL